MVVITVVMHVIQPKYDDFLEILRRLVSHECGRILLLPIWVFVLRRQNARPDPRCDSMFVHRKVRKKSINILGFQLLRVPPTMKTNIAQHPMHIGLFRCIGHVAAADKHPQTVDKPRRRGG